MNLQKSPSSPLTFETLLGQAEISIYEMGPGELVTLIEKLKKLEVQVCRLREKAEDLRTLKGRLFTK